MKALLVLGLSCVAPLLAPVAMATRAQSGISLNDGDGPEPVCLTSARFAVEAQWRADDSGSDILVRPAGANALPAPGEPCRYEPRADDLILSDLYPDEALYVSALADRFLVMESSTGPQTRLIVADLAAKSSALVADNAEIESVTPEGVDYWATSEGADASFCPDYEETLATGLTPVIDARWFFSFDTAQADKRQETRCSAMQ